MLRRQPVVKAQHVHGGGLRQLGGQRPGVQTASSGIAASVAVQNHILFHMGTVHANPLAIHAVYIDLSIIELSDIAQYGP